MISIMNGLLTCVIDLLIRLSYYFLSHGFASIACIYHFYSLLYNTWCWILFCSFIPSLSLASILHHVYVLHTDLQFTDSVALISCNQLRTMKLYSILKRKHWNACLTYIHLFHVPYFLFKLYSLDLRIIHIILGETTNIDLIFIIWSCSIVRHSASLLLI